MCILVFVKDTCGIVEESSPLESTYWKTLTQRERRKEDSLWVFTHVVVQPKDLVFKTDSSPTSENQVVILFVREDTIIQKQVILIAASDCDTFVWGEREKLHSMHLVDKAVIIINNEKTSRTHWRYNSKKDRVLMCWHPFDFFGVSLKKNPTKQKTCQRLIYFGTAIKKTLKKLRTTTDEYEIQKLSQGSWSGYYQRKYLCSKNNLFQDSNNLLPINSLFLIW